MVEEKKKKNKGLIIAIVILILLVLGFGGYIVYDKVLKEKPTKVEEPKEIIEEADFYDVSELVKNKYIEKIENTSIQDYNNITLIEIRDGKVYVIDNMADVQNSKLVEAKGIEGTPKYVYETGFQSMFNTMFAVSTEEGDVYYTDYKTYHENGDESYKTLPFKKVNTEKVINIYKHAIVQNIDYPYEVNTIYLELENGKLVSLVRGELGKTFEEMWQYTDQICGENAAIGCNLGLVFSQNKILYNGYYNSSIDGWSYEKIKYNGKDIKAKDAFSISKENITADENGIETSEGFDANFYVIGEDNYIYTMQKKLSDEDHRVSKIKLYKNEKISSYEYNITNDEYGNMTNAEIKITYVNGQTETIKNLYAISTLYFRYNK